jgi:hypothetical protein
MSRTSLRVGGIVVLLGACLAIGCPKSGPARPKTYPVTGKVTLNGEAVEGATVSFQAAKNSASGTTDANGIYKLTTFAAGDGAVPGQYKVAITKFEGGAPSGGAAAGSSGSASGELPADYKAPEEGGAQPAAPKNVLPSKYADANASGLTATVTEGQNTAKDFELTE